MASRIFSSCMTPPDRVRVSLSRNARNKTGAAGLHDLVEPLPGLNPVDLVERVLREGGDIEILSRSGRGLGRGKQSGATLDRPGEQHLCWRLFNARGNPQDDRILQRPRFYSVPQWRKGQEHDALLLAEFQELGFRKIRMGFYLDRGRLDSCRFVEGLQFVQADVRESDGPASSTVDEIFHPLPRIVQSHAFVVEDISIFIARILLVSRMKCKRRMNEIKVQVIDPKSFKACLKGRF